MGWGTAAAIADTAVKGAGLAIEATSNKRAYKWGSKMAEDDYKRSQSMALFNQKLQQEMWEKTGPVGQMEQLTKAGLNPGLIYGMGGAGGQTAAASPAQSHPGQMRHDNIGMNIANMANTSKTVAELKLLDAQRKNIDADTQNKISENPNIPKTGQEIEARTANLLQGVENAKAQQELTKTQNEIAKLESDAKLATFNDAVEMVMRNRQIAVENLKSLRRNNTIGERTMETKIATIQAEYAGILIQNALNKQRTAESASAIQVNMSQIKSMIIRNAQDWLHLEYEGRGTTEKEREGHHQRFINDMQTSTKLSIETIKSILSAVGIAEGMMNKKPTQHYHETINYGGQ